MKILVVDDDEQIRSTLTHALEAQSFVVKTACSAEEGWSWLLTEPFDVVVTDCDMGKVSGLTFARKLRDIHPSIPIVMFSGNDSAKECFLDDAGGTKFFLKTELVKLVTFIVGLQ